MALKQTWCSRFASASPFVLAKERLYQITDRSRDAEPDYLTVCSRTLALAPGPSIAELEQFERQRFRRDIFPFQKKYVAEALQQEIRSREDIRDYANVLAALRFILYELLPLAIETAYEQGELLGVELSGPKTGKEMLEQIVAQELDKVKGESETAINIEELRNAALQRLGDGRIKPLLAPRNETKKTKRVEPSSLLGKILGGNDVYVAMGKIYQLVPVAEGNNAFNDELAVVLKHKPHYVMHTLGIPAVERAYQAAFMQELRRHALQEMVVQEDLLARLKGSSKTREAMELFAQRKEFNIGNLGYVRNGESFYIYWETPKFAMQNPLKPEQYHPFPATKVAIPVNASGSKMYAGDPLIINAMVHPFLRDWETGYQRICILSQQGSAYGNAPYGMIRKLSTAVNAFMNGLTRESVEAHGAVSEDANYFYRPLRDSLNKAGRLSREQALQQGYRLTNEWSVWDKGKKKAAALQREL